MQWSIGIPGFIIIISLIVALATTVKGKATDKDVAILATRVSVLEGQFTSILSNQARIENLLGPIDARQRDSLERLVRIEEALCQTKGVK
jgi:hypothetical protein